MHRAVLARLECVARKAWREHAIKTDEGALRIVRAQRMECVACSVEWIDSIGPRPEGIPAACAQHAHTKTAVLFLIMRNPAFLEAAWRKDAAGDGVADNDVPIVSDARMQDGIMRGFLAEKTD